MTPADAITLLAPAVAGTGGTWLDLGAGAGTFTRALASLLGGTGRVVAVERDPAALQALRLLAREAELEGRVEVLEGDLQAVDRVPGIHERRYDGALLANVLHFLAGPASILAGVAKLVRPGAAVVIIEYEREAANRYVPHPLPLAALQRAAAGAGLGMPRVVGRRPSLWQGEMYCAVLPVGIRPDG